MDDRVLRSTTHRTRSFCAWCFAIATIVGVVFCVVGSSTMGTRVKSSGATPKPHELAGDIVVGSRFFAIGVMSITFGAVSGILSILLSRSDSIQS